MKDKKCFWEAAGICAFNISAPGQLVPCCISGCKSWEAPLTSQMYQERQQSGVYGQISPSPSQNKGKCSEHERNTYEEAMA